MKVDGKVIRAFISNPSGSSPIPERFQRGPPRRPVFKRSPRCCSMEKVLSYLQHILPGEDAAAAELAAAVEQRVRNREAGAPLSADVPTCQWVLTAPSAAHSHACRGEMPSRRAPTRASRGARTAGRDALSHLRCNGCLPPEA